MDSTRTLLHNRVPPKLRSLHILDLADELLIRIFDYVKGDTGLYELYFFDYPLGNVDAIKSLRLTCRRFCETSSHLLLYYVNVKITRPSLAHLDEVSRHSSVCKGVRVIKLSLSPFYDSVLAHNIHLFAAYRASKLRQSIESWDHAIDWQLSGETPIDVYQVAIAKAVPLAESWEEVVARGIDTNNADHLMILRAHEQYLQLYEDYKNLSGTFTQAIASAMARMPTATWVNVEDDDCFSCAMGYFRPNDLDETDSLLENLLSPIGWSDVRKYGLGPPPFNLIGELLLSIQRLEIPLAGLNIETPPPTARDSPSNTVTTHEPAVLRSAIQQLKAFKFRPRSNIWSKCWTLRAPDEWVHFTNFLLNLLHTKSLQKIDLSFSFMGTNDPPPLLSMAPLLLSYTWPNLKILSFNGPFHFEELKAVAKPLGNNVELEWSGYLMSGSWAEVLDFLRERNAPGQRVGDVNGSVYGQECVRMKKAERNFIFQANTSWSPVSRATEYIRGWLPRNPVRDWDMGELDMPEPPEDDEEDDEDDE